MKKFKFLFGLFTGPLYFWSDLKQNFLKNLIVNDSGGPTGGKSLAISINEDIQTIEDVYEPYLIKEGFIERTSRGRVATDRAYKLFGMNKPGSEE